MSSQTKIYFTPEEYLTLERRAETKSEYFNGEMFEMGGANREHNIISGNVVGQLMSRRAVRQTGGRALAAGCC